MVDHFTQKTVNTIEAMRTATLETSIKLQEAAIVVETYFHWMKWAWGGATFVADKEADHLQTDEAIVICPAPTFDEIWELLPKNISGYRLTMDDEYICYRNVFELNPLNSIPIKENIAEAAAQLLLWCKENGHLK